MKLNSFVDKIFCINLKHRTDKKKFIIGQARKYNFRVSFFNAIENKKNPMLGCLQSHLSIIKLAKERKYKSVLIMEDDCQFVTEPIIYEKELPEDWQQLFLGCNLMEILESDIQNVKHKKFIRMKCLATHSYILKSSAYDELINGLSNNNLPVDVYYKDHFQDKRTSYMIYPQLTTQKEGYSDIEQRVLKYALQDVDDFIKIKDAPHKYNEETLEYILKLKNFTDNELPFVSILTPTKNRKSFFKMAIHCFQNYDYPKHKLEWVIIDDSDDGSTLRDILPRDKRIKYIKLTTKRKIPVSEKRNMCVKYASHDIFINQDDDDYYLSHSIKTRVKVLLTYPKINMVGCGVVCCYDVSKKKFYNVGGKTTLAEATMCFRRKFFEERYFNKKVKLGEGILFLRDRKHECYRIPYTFVLFVMNHKKNVTNTIRQVTDKKHFIDYYELPEDIIKIIQN